MSYVLKSSKSPEMGFAVSCREQGQYKMCMGVLGSTFSELSFEKTSDGKYKVKDLKSGLPMKCIPGPPTLGVDAYAASFYDKAPPSDTEPKYIDSVELKEVDGSVSLFIGEDRLIGVNNPKQPMAIFFPPKFSDSPVALKFDMFTSDGKKVTSLSQIREPGMSKTLTIGIIVGSVLALIILLCVLRKYRVL